MVMQRATQVHANRPSVLSEERITDSDSDEELQHSKPAHTIPKHSLKQRKPLANGNEHNKPRPKLSPKVDSSPEENALLETEASEDGSHDDNDLSSSITKKRPVPTAKAAHSKSTAKPTVPSAIAPKAFKHPNGFGKATFSATDYASDTTAFLTENLTNKQVWHITAPASVDIGSIKPFNIQDVQSGKPVFSKNGVDYGFLTGMHKQERLLLANNENVEYAQTTARISGIYHLREIGTLRTKNDATGHEENVGVAFTATSAIPPKKPREQPDGLRMRYQPYGTHVEVYSNQYPTSTTPRPRMAAELPESLLDKSEKRRRKQQQTLKQVEESESADAMDIDRTQFSALRNSSTGTPGESASDMVNKAFEAATDTSVKEKKRKRRHKLIDETLV